MCYVTPVLQFTCWVQYTMTDAEMDRARHDFDELIVALVTLSSSAERQKEICGVGCPGDEMAVDFETYYTHCRDRYEEHGILSAPQVEALDELDQYLEDRSGQSDSSEKFWLDPDALGSHPDWAEIRRLAHSCLVALGKSHLELRVDHVITHTQGPKGEPLVIQRTQTKLVPRERPREPPGPDTPTGEDKDHP